MDYVYSITEYTVPSNHGWNPWIVEHRSYALHHMPHCTQEPWVKPMDYVYSITEYTVHSNHGCNPWIVVHGSVVHGSCASISQHTAPSNHGQSPCIMGHTQLPSVDTLYPVPMVAPKDHRSCMQ